MAAHFFGQYLLEKGLISRDALLDALEFQKRINLPLGALAIEKKYLTTEQVKAIHAEQQRTDKKFGEIAVEKKWLTKAQLDDLLKSQAERWVFLGEALVEKKYLTYEQLEAELQEYRKEQEKDRAVVETDLEAIPEKEVVEAYLDVSIKLFLRIAREVVKIVSVGLSEEPLEESFVIAQKVNGDKTFHFALALPESLTLTIASQLINKDQTEVNELVLDAVSEFLNIIVGNGCAKLNLKEYRVEPEPPKAYKKGEQMPFSGRCVCAAMASTKGPFQMRFYFD